MIPHDRILFDGEHAWLIVDEYIAAWKLDDRPCETCDDNCFACPCIDGRHTFDIEVDEPSGCGRCDPWTSHLVDHLYGENCGTLQCDQHRPTSTYRVSIVPGMVLPIVLAQSKLPESTVIVDWENRYGGNPRFAVSPVDSDGHYITLPPAAAPGMWAVRLKVAQ